MRRVRITSMGVDATALPKLATKLDLEQISVPKKCQFSSICNLAINREYLHEMIANVITKIRYQL